MDFEKYIAANTAWVELLKQARECKTLYEEAGSSVPEELKVFLGTGSPSKPALRRRTKRDAMSIRLPLHPYLTFFPPESKSDWIAVPAEDASLSTLVLAVMRSENLSTLGAVQEAVRTWQAGTVPNSVYNVANRLSAEGIATKDGSNFTLNRPENVPTLRGKLIWGSSAQMGDSDRASFRRKVIVDLLKANPGLEVMQMVRILTEIPWFPPRFHKDILKSDLQALMGDMKVRRSSDGRGWMVIEKEVSPEEKTS